MANILEIHLLKKYNIFINFNLLLRDEKI